MEERSTADHQDVLIKPSGHTLGESREESLVKFEARNSIAILTLARPSARNAISPKMSQEIERAVDRLEADDQLLVGILAAQGPVFSSGADLAAVLNGEGEQILTERGGFGGFVFRERRKPIIAAVEGPAVAGGFEIASACDLIVASREASFSLPEVKRSLIAAAGGLTRLPKIVGLNVALEIALTGEAIEAERAYNLGLVNRLTEPGKALEVAVGIAETIASNGPIAVRESRRLVRAASQDDDQSLHDMAVQASMANMETEDAREGTQSFLERRAPQWKGR